MEFKGKTALITGSGAAGGLGHAIAESLAAGGAKVLLTGRDPQRGVQVADALGGEARFLAAELGDPESVRALATEVGAVDILINNAALMTGEARDIREFDDVFAVNVRAPFLLATALAPKMVANGGGSIVNISSTAAGIGMPDIGVYGATKAALESLTRAWAAEYAPGKVRVNAVAPGPMHTSKAVAAIGADLGGYGGTVPLNRSADPAEVAEVVAFVASDRAGYMTGAIVPVDGGRAAI
ncbi:SDR family NAD(P)-dependent oxidoreductase [Amycolatopsis sp. NPDC058340]|uniref:SDR family NAD(P)-dependent oxidoreductase n=1 Tax=Amycolatopsis sp. NPDC058340 TaxID=3346453 RepID=UPI003659DAEB